MSLARKPEAQDPRSLQARIDAAMGKTPRRRRWRRYAVGVGLTWAAIWGLAAAYVLLTPQTWTSRWALILPGSGSQISVSLDSIGQSSSAPTPQFSGPSLSPKVIYKEIAQSEQVRQLAARLIDARLDEMPRPRIRLIEETSLLYLEARGRSPEQARRRAEALNSALGIQLDRLRRDELEKRAAAVRDNLKGYQEQVTAARARIIEAQRASGLMSVSQWNELSSSVVVARRRLTEVRAEVERLGREQALLTERLGVEPRLASLALRLAGDPAVARLAAEHAEAAARHAAELTRLGPGNPQLVIAAKRREATVTEIGIAAVAALGARVSTGEAEQLAGLLNGSHRADLFKSVVASEAVLAGRRREEAAIETEIDRLQAEVRDGSEAAARLEDLRKDQIVAEAVLTSAMARLDTSKSDIYGSYPLVQLLAAPDLPDVPTQPVVGMAVAGGLGASLIASLAWMLAWFTPGSGRRRRKND